VSDSLWKKEISFRRKPKEDALAAVPELEPVVAIEPEPAPVPEPAEDTAVPAELPAPKGDYGWLTTSFDPTDLPDEMPRDRRAACFRSPAGARATGRNGLLVPR